MQKGKVTIFRYNPETDTQPHYETYEYPFEPGMSVLDVATYVCENIDPSFSFSYGCRNSHCGVCGAKINAEPGLMCREGATPEMTLEPLDNLPLIRDIMVDWNYCDEWMLSLRLFLERTKTPLKEPEIIDREDLERFKIVSRCVACHSCTSVCPAFQENRHAFWGPAAFVQLARHAFDPRDELNREIMAHSAGIQHCTLCGKCKKVCPHGISPKKSIELLLTRIEARKNG